MILGFKTEWRGQPTHFREKILYGAGQEEYSIYGVPKLHTIRSGERWKAGMKIHMANGVRTKKYVQFNRGIENLSTCVSVQSIHIFSVCDLPDHLRDERVIIVHRELKDDLGTVRVPFRVQVDDRFLMLYEVKALALRDGFDDVKDFITTGEKSNHNNGYGGLYSSHWGYSETDMIAIQEKAKTLGYL